VDLHVSDTWDFRDFSDFKGVSEEELSLGEDFASLVEEDSRAVDQACAEARGVFGLFLFVLEVAIVFFFSVRG
jgi:hypothetical protein